MIYQLWNYIASFIVMCSSSFFNAQQCLQVWNYMPAYLTDLNRAINHKPYQLEQELINEIRSSSPEYLQELL